MNYTVETERLALRPLQEGDAQFIIELVNSPGWIAFIGDRNIRTQDDAVRYLREGPMKSYETNGFGLSLVELKTSGVPIGMCGLLKRDSLEHPDIGFAFLPEFMNRGYAFEIASATMAYAERVLNISEIWAITLPANQRSIRLLEKLGLKFVRTITSPTDHAGLLLYSNHRR